MTPARRAVLDQVAAAVLALPSTGTRRIGVDEAPEERAAPGSILLLDGMFLHGPELRATWDLSVSCASSGTTTTGWTARPSRRRPPRAATATASASTSRSARPGSTPAS